MTLSAPYDSLAPLFPVQWVVCQYVPLSHLFWSGWALLQTELSSVDFDFQSYAEKRINAYYAHNPSGGQSEG